MPSLFIPVATMRKCKQISNSNLRYGSDVIDRIRFHRYHASYLNCACVYIRLLMHALQLLSTSTTFMIYLLVKHCEVALAFSSLILRPALSVFYSLGCTDNNARQWACQLNWGKPGSIQHDSDIFFLMDRGGREVVNKFKH